MTKQEIFDTVVKHMLTQGGRAVFVDFSGEICCVYRSLGGGKCALGCLIPDDEYRPEMERMLAPQLIRSELSPTITAMADEHGSEFLSQLQQAHDTAQSGAATEAYLRSLAGLYDLSTAVLDGQSFPVVWQ